MSNKQDRQKSLRRAVFLLANRGLDWGDIARILEIEKFQVRGILQPRVTIGGPCERCATNYIKTPVRLTSAHCHHYGATFDLERGRVRPLALSRESHLARLRAEAGPAPKSRRKGPEGITAQESDGARFIARCRREDSLQFIDPSTPE